MQKGQRIFLKKNDTSRNDKIPYFTLTVPPEEDGGDWKDIGAFWKSKSGAGYSGILDANVRLDISAVLTWREKKDMKKEADTSQQQSLD